MTDVRTRRERHAANCRLPSAYLAEWGYVGSVRRCPHGIIQEGIDVPGWGSACWRDLSAIFTPFRWRRARRALSQGSA